MTYNRTIEEDMIAMEAAAQELMPEKRADLSIDPNPVPYVCDARNGVEAKESHSSGDASTCNFSEMVPLFQELFDPHPSRLTALMANIRNLLRLGGAVEAKRGHGRASLFTKAQVWELLTLMELTHLGMGPQKAITVYRENEDRFRNAWDWVVEVVPSDSRSSGIKIDCFSLNAAAKRALPELWGAS